MNPKSAKFTILLNPQWTKVHAIICQGFSVFKKEDLFTLNVKLIVCVKSNRKEIYKLLLYISALVLHYSIMYSLFNWFSTYNINAQI